MLRIVALATLWAVLLALPLVPSLDPRVVAFVVLLPWLVEAAHAGPLADPERLRRVGRGTFFAGVLAVFHVQLAGFDRLAAEGGQMDWPDVAPLLGPMAACLVLGLGLKLLLYDVLAGFRE